MIAQYNEELTNRKPPKIIKQKHIELPKRALNKEKTNKGLTLEKVFITMDIIKSGQSKPHRIKL